MQWRQRQAAARHQPPRAAAAPQRRRRRSAVRRCPLISLPHRALPDHLCQLNTFNIPHTLLQSGQHKPNMGLGVSRRLVVLTCMDSRLLPEHFLGLAQGEAEVIRNGGGRVTEDVIRCEGWGGGVAGRRWWGGVGPSALQRRCGARVEA